MEPVGGAVDEVAKVATATVEVGAKTAASSLENVARVVTPIVESTDKVSDQTAPTIESLQQTVDALKAQQSAPTGMGSENTNPQKETKTNIEASQSVENKDEQKENSKKISQEPRYQEILGRIASQEANKNVPVEKLQEKARAIYGQEILDEIAQEDQTPEITTFTKEKKADMTKTIKEAFKDPSIDMENFTRYASALAKAKSNEIKLQNDEKATQEQKSEAAKLTPELQRRYDIKLNDMKERLRKEKPNEDPEKNILIILLRQAPNNPEVLKAMQREKKYNLLKIILSIVAAPIVSAADETRKGAMPSTGQ